MNAVALLRGINIGGRHLLPMKELAAIFTTAGCRDVRTWLQSGNVLFAAADASVAKLPAVIAKAISRRFGFDVPVVIRSSDDLRKVAKANPYQTADDLHVAFLADRPAAAAVAALDPDRSPGDTFTLRGREIYLRLPNGVARSRLTNAWFDAQLATVSTIRTWSTVVKLAALIHAGDS